MPNLQKNTIEYFYTMLYCVLLGYWEWTVISWQGFIKYFDMFGLTWLTDCRQWTGHEEARSR